VVEAEVEQERAAAPAEATWWRTAIVVVTAASLLGVAFLAPGGAEKPSHVLAWLLFVGSSMHVASTGWFFTSPSVRRHAVDDETRALIVVPLCLVLGCVACALLLPSKRLSWLLLLFFAWQFHHFQKQNVGLVALSALSAGASALRLSERRSVVLAGLFGIMGLLADPGLLQLHPYPSLMWARAVALAGYLLVVVAGACTVLRRRRGQPVGVSAMYVTALLFPLPIFVFTSPYAAVGGMTVAHGLQYLMLMGLVAKGSESTKSVRPVESGRAGLAIMCGIALVGGVALSATSHLHLSSSPVLRGVFGLYLGLVCAHFLVDARLWRLSRPFSRAFLGSRIPFLNLSGVAAMVA
jgi:hypothetical protein